ncbi:MAG: hypothetical protein A3G76_01420 [Acidobacteria bacterium RIFCSPLOWO2_12_FULL_65_11]|nr:MAG: hypothetical protein A3H95_04085 [Acidobacteria bacterium RIFCSPLOWO2_02_FULL_64_15]OFW28807.1 MAG: hypothetical protein A3G76_01420 [Acidobacteria bacterium RIFCSPLOWO2_12_FULL_65_11]
MKRCHDEHARFSDFVLKPIFVHEHFANGWIVQFRNDSPTVSQRRQAGTDTQRLIENLQGALLGIVRDVPDNRIERVSGGFGSDDFGGRTRLTSGIVAG